MPQENNSARQTDGNGFIIVKKNPISKVGVFPYSGAMIGADEPSKIYNVYRPEEELSNPECIASFKLVPFVDEHTMLGVEATPAEKKGVQGVTGEEVEFEDGTLYSNLKVFSESLANLIENGKKELSCGYRCVYEFAKGVWNGIEYDAIQRNIRGNHLALVQEGRMGHEVAVLDSMVFTFDTKELLMPEEIEKKVEDAEEVTLKGLAAKVDAIASIIAKLKPMEEEEHGISLDEEMVEDEIEEETEDAVTKSRSNAGVPPKPASGMDVNDVKRSVIKEIAQRDSLYSKVSNVVGAFDHSEMNLKELAKYSTKKLGLNCADGAEVFVLEGYLAGVSKSKTVVGKAMDSKPNCADLDSYLKGGK